MIHKRLLSAIALVTLAATIVAFTIPSQAKKDSSVQTSESITSEVSFASEEGRGVTGNSGIADDFAAFEQNDIAEANSELLAGAENSEITEVSVQDISIPAAGAAATIGEGSALVAEEESEEETQVFADAVTAGMPSEIMESMQGNGSAIEYNAYADVRDYVHVRSEASEYSAPIGMMPDGAILEVLSEEDGWYMIRSGNVTGYVRSKDCVTGDEAAEYIKNAAIISASVAEDSVALRTGPDKKSTSVAILPAGESVEVLADVSDWARVETSEGIGFVYKPLLNIQKEYTTALTLEEVSRKEKDELRREQEEAALKNVVYNCSNGQPTHFVSRTGGSKEGRDVVEFALQFVGNPYVMGGTSLTEGCDCSGFVMSVYKEFGFTLTHSTEIDQREGVAVESIETAEPGDIICYQGHVAIYMGDGMIVHAAGEAKGIRIAPACYTDIITIRRMFAE